MAHEYSVTIHDWLNTRSGKIKQDLSRFREKNETASQYYCQGQMDQIREIRQYLTDKIDLDTQKYY